MAYHRNRRERYANTDRFRQFRNSKITNNLHSSHTRITNISPKIFQRSYLIPNEKYYLSIINDRNICTRLNKMFIVHRDYRLSATSSCIVFHKEKWSWKLDVAFVWLVALKQNHNDKEFDPENYIGIIWHTLNDNLRQARRSKGANVISSSTPWGWWSPCRSPPRALKVGVRRQSRWRKRAITVIVSKRTIPTTHTGENVPMPSSRRSKFSLKWGNHPTTGVNGTRHNPNTPLEDIAAEHAGFRVLSICWVVEPTHERMQRWRRTLIHHDRKLTVSAAWEWLTEAHMLLTRPA